MLTYKEYRAKVIASDPDYQYSESEIQEMYSYYTSSMSEKKTHKKLDKIANRAILIM